MEQRIGSSNKSLDVAAIDPAHIPGLTSPGSEKSTDEAGPEDAVAADAVKGDAVEPDVIAGEAVATDAEETDSADAEESAPAAKEAESAGETDSAGEATSAEAEPAPGSPVFEAADRRAKIVADHGGVRLQLDDQDCEFRWDEIGAVETESPRFGKRFTITVHTPDRRWYPIEIEAKSRAQHKEWEARLDEVLDAYFEDAEDAQGAEHAERAEEEAEQSTS